MGNQAIGERVVIMGGGITGTLTARELALNGWSVKLAEAGHVGAGSSSRTAAGIRQTLSTPVSVRGMRYSGGFYKEFARDVDGGQSPITQSGHCTIFGPFSARATCTLARVI